MRILFLSPRQCWPPQTGAKLREFHLAHALGRRAELTHVSFHEPLCSPLTAQELPFCKEVISLPKPKAYTPAKILQGLWGRWPLPVANYMSDEMMQKLDQLLERERFDLIHLDSLHMTAYLPALRKLTAAIVVYDWHNIESELMFRYGQNVRSMPRRLYANATGRRLEDLERTILRDGSRHIVCSERERLKLKDIAPAAQIDVIENGVDARSFSDVASKDTTRNRILFVGSMNYHANVEGAEYFAHRVWPKLHQQYPGWRLTLVGSSPAPAVVALRQLAGIEVTGTVPDVRPYYREAIVAVVPLQTGGGTRLKILEAMAAGVPVVSTAVGAEGLAVAHDRNILLANSEDDWYEMLASVSSDENLRNKLVRKASELVRTRYDWEILGEQIYRTYCRWQERAA